MVLVVAFDTSFASSVGHVAYLLSFVGPPVLIPCSSSLLPLQRFLCFILVLHKSTIDSLVVLGVGFLFGGTVAALWLGYYNYMCIIIIITKR